MKSFISFVCFLCIILVHQSAQQNLALNSYSKSLPVTSKHFNLFTNAFTSYRNSTHNNLCIMGIYSLRRRTIDTMSYEFTIGGCRSSKCSQEHEIFVSDSYCKEVKKYNVWIYESAYEDAIVQMVEPAPEPILDGGFAGGYQGTLMTTEVLATLENGLQKSKEHSNFCKVQIISLRQQVVNGMNYEFTIRGCENDVCKSRNGFVEKKTCSTINDYKIRIYKSINGESEVSEFNLITPNEEKYEPALLKDSVIDFTNKAIVSYAEEQKLDLCFIGIFSVQSKESDDMVYEAKTLVCKDKSCATKIPSERMVFSPADTCKEPENYAIVFQHYKKGGISISSIAPLDSK